MTAKPMTPKEDVEAVASIMDRGRESLAAVGRIVDISGEAPTMLRALLAERDELKEVRDEGERQLQKSFDDLAAMMAERDELTGLLRQCRKFISDAPGLDFNEDSTLADIAVFGAHLDGVLSSLPIKDQPDD